MKYKQKCAELRSTIARLTYDVLVKEKRAEYEAERHREAKLALYHCRERNEALLAKLKQLERIEEVAEERYKGQILSQAETLKEKDGEIEKLRETNKRLRRKVFSDEEIQEIIAKNRHLKYNKDNNIKRSRMKKAISVFLAWFSSLPDFIQILTYGALGTALTLLSEDIKTGTIEWAKYWIIGTTYLSNIVLYAAKKFLEKKTA